MKTISVDKVIIELVDMLVDSCKKDTSSKDGYVLMMSFMEKIPANAKKNFILACIQRGYPANTGNEIIKILGL